ncbi:TIGR01777 family oxidoreductase [Ichthyenterobacterium magnum]|uniref:TIGR01777 family protein n=1 Tax=Ichthyenterobacterium magnum TaxID=1230530 RepID=A0A420DEJ9_9FLAO|nr:TIGR01777 family oxidoreductase [Ichthyenterobacterium magnum]RKE90838.1 hypothetical protein BXY80_2681 [Ichthyenterobacterium magnum]
MKTKILITGATGLIGQEIAKACLEKGYKIHYLTTSKVKISNEDNYKGFYWNPKEGEIDKSCFKNVSVIINLAGASISKRWTDSYKKEILESRTQALQLLKETIKVYGFKIQHIISASAIGIYPDSLINYYKEDYHEVSSSFLGQVVSQWESAVDEFSNLKIKVTKIRIGLVLSNKGGALLEIAKPIQFGFGAAFGSGKQWQSWIHIKDLAELFVFIKQHNIEGTYNAVAPNPVSNKELVKAVAKVLKKPLLLPNIPKSVMKLILGEMHELLFESHRVSSRKTENLGFNFKYHHLQKALRDLFPFKTNYIQK